MLSFEEMSTAEMLELSDNFWSIQATLQKLSISMSRKRVINKSKTCKRESSLSFSKTLSSQSYLEL